MEHAQGVGAGADRSALVRAIMRRQARLGLAVAAVFVLILVGLPLLNLYQPELMATRVGGFSLTWLLLAVLFYPVTWLLSWLFVRGSDRIEAQISAEFRAGIAEGAAPRSPLPAPHSDAPPVTNRQSPTTKKRLFVEDEE